MVTQAKVAAGTGGDRVRLSSGVPGFDALVQGGIPGGAAVIIQGPAGREKDAFLLQFVAEGLKGGGCALIVLSSTSPAKYQQHLREAGVDIDRALGEDRVKFVDWFTYKENPVQDVEQDGHVFRASIDLANVGIAISRAVGALSRGGERRAAIEVLSPALSTYDLSAVYGFAQSTKAKLERSNFTTLFALEKEMHDERTVSSIHQPFEGVVDIDRVREGDTIVRKLAVLSLEGTAAESKYVPLEVGPDHVLRVSTAPARERTLLRQEELIKSNPKDPKLWLATARNLRAMGENERGLRCVEAALKLDATDQEAWRLKAEILDALGRKEEAEQARAARNVPPAPAVKDDPEARLIGILERRLAENSRDGDALFLLAAARAKAHDLGGAVAYLDRLADVDERYPGLWILKTKLHAQRGELEKAEASRARRQALEDREDASRLKPPPTRVAQPQAMFFCPSCGSPVREEDSVCASCGALFEEDGPAVVPPAQAVTSKREAITESPTPEVPKRERPPRPQMAERRRQVLRKRVPVPRSQAHAAPVEPARRRMTNGLGTDARPRGPGRTNGLVNGNHGRTNGLVNGNRGRTNGLVNGNRGRTNGLVNGTRGRTNGLVNGNRRRTNGLVNGTRGRTNGLVNGLRTLRSGLTNGLTNGSGFTNGLGGAHLARETNASRWKVYLIPIVCGALLLFPVFGPEGPTGSTGIVVDGAFADWQGVRSHAMTSGATPNIDITGVALESEADSAFLLVRVRGQMLAGEPSPGSRTDVVFVFVDIDANPATGYTIRGLGADRLLAIRGREGAATQAMAYQAAPSGDARDWRNWRDPAWTTAAAAGDQLEVGVDWLLLEGARTSAVFFVATMGWDGATDFADLHIGSGPGHVRIVQRHVAPQVLSGATAPLLTLGITAEDGPIEISGITVDLLGTVSISAVGSLTLVSGIGVPLAQRIPVSRQIPFTFPAVTLNSGDVDTWTVVGAVVGSGGETLGVRVASPRSIDAGSAVVTLTTVATLDPLGYTGGLPAAPAIDGGFAEWASAAADATGETTTRGNPSVDLSRFAVVAGQNSFAFYARLQGPAFAGTVLPTAPVSVGATGTPPDRDRDSVPNEVDLFPDDFDNDGVPDLEEGGDQDGDGLVDHTYGGPDLFLNTTIPPTFPAPYAGNPVSVYIGPSTEPPAIGEDTLRLYVDTDNVTGTGFSVAGLGADVLIEIAGREGVVGRAEILDHNGVPWDWSWTSRAGLVPAVGLLEMEAAANLTALGAVYVETSGWGGAGDVLGPTTRAEEGVVRPSTRGEAGPPNVLDISGNQKLYLRDTTHSSETACTTNKVASGTQGTTSLKSVTLSAGESACWYADSTTGTTISSGDWETLLDVDTSVPKSAFKDGSSASVPTGSIALIDSMSTVLPAKDNLVVAAIQFDNTNAATRSITAGNLELRRGTTTMLAENQFAIDFPASGGAGDGMFAVLLYRDTSGTADPTYGVYGLASGSGVNAEVKFLVLNGLASADSAFTDGGSVTITGSTTSVASVSTSFPASSSSLPNIIVAAVQSEFAGSGEFTISAGNLVLRRGTTSGSTVIASNQYAFGLDDPPTNDGISAVLVAEDESGASSQGYSVWGLSGVNNMRMEAKILAFRGLSANAVDGDHTNDIDTSRVVLGTATTSFAAGDDIVIGAIQIDAQTSSTIPAAGDDIRRNGESSGSSNQFTHRIAHSTSYWSDGQWQTFVRKVTTTSSSPSYEGGATGDATNSIDAEVKLIAIHVNDSAANYDVHLEIWNLNTNDVAETIKSCTGVATRGEDVRCFITGVASKTISGTQVVRIRLVHSSSSGKVTFDYDFSDPTGNSRATIPATGIPEFQDIALPVLATVIVPFVWRRFRRKRFGRAGGMKT